MSLAKTSKAPIVYLVGMPGCGKSTVGKELAQALHYTFLDLDTLVEEQEQATVPQVFEAKGQEYFRQAEAKALRQVTELKEGVVLATGGGSPCFHGNMAYMVNNGTAVYLQLTPDQLVARLTLQDLQARPLLRGKSPQELQAYLTQTLTQRETFYAQAPLAIEVGSQTVPQIVQAIQERLEWPA